jgi:hypothetical protein
VSDVFEDPFEYVNDEREFSKLSSGGNVTCFPTDSEVNFTELKMNFFNW